MGKLFVQINVSLDGYIDRGPGEIDWKFVDDEFETFMNETLASLDAMIFGRRAFELLQGYWPNAGNDPGISAQHRESVRWMNQLPKYVLSKTLSDTSWSNSQILRNLDDVREVKERSARDVALFAGGQAVSSAVANGLAEELRLILNPALLKGGTPLWSGEGQPEHFGLEDVRRFRSGALVLRYRRR